MPPNVKDIFNEYKLKIIQYTANQIISEEKLELVKRDLFRRYNMGMTALKKSEIERAKYDGDFITQEIEENFNKSEKFYNQCLQLFLPDNKINEDNREKKNIILIEIRKIMTIPYVPIINEKTIKLGAVVLEKYYEKFLICINQKEKIDKIKELMKIIDVMFLIKENLKNSNNELNNNILFLEVTYWMLTILYEEYPNYFYNFDVDKFCHYIRENGIKYFENYRNINAIHIEKRHEYTKNYINNELKLSIDSYINKTKENRKNIIYVKKEKPTTNEDWMGIGNTKQVITVRDTMSMNDIIKRINEKRFIIRAEYQRGEVKNKYKASKIIESIMLGVKIPPIYVYSIVGKDGRERLTVLDGQQRLISILSFMGKQITDNQYNYITTSKHKFALTGLKDLEGLKGYTYTEGKNELNPFKKKIIDDYKIEMIKINEQGNEGFDFVDMFLRLNQNPCPIAINSFEMWNSFDIVECIDKIKEISKFELFKQNGNQMKEEELVTALAYMQYKDITLENLQDFFQIYIFKENKNKQNEHLEVKLSIKRKYELTDFLEDMRTGTEDERKFLKSIESVNTFIDKLNILSEENGDNIIRIFNPHIKKARIGNKKDFYIMWLILNKLDNHIVKTYKQELLKDLEKAYKLMKNMPNDKEPEAFIDYIKNMTNKYSKYSI